MIRAAVLGAAGYMGGELLRLLLGHPEVEVAAAASSQFPGRRIDGRHPNLRAQTDMRFCPMEQLETYDALFLATPHGTAMQLMPGLMETAKHVFDLSADFRLRDESAYDSYYEGPHLHPELLGEFVTGCPEFFREELAAADRVAIPGCMAIAAMLAVHPLADRGLIGREVFVDARTGSSGAGATAGEPNIHAERSGAMRVFAPQGHRHEAEIAQLTGRSVHMSATGVEAVRGVQVLCRAQLSVEVDELALRKLYLEYYRGEPFVRIVTQRRGIHRYPEPKILLGSNYCDVGFSVDTEAGEVLAIAAVDNLMKGGAGNAVHCLNIRRGWPETMGLSFPGLHPV